MSSTAQTCRTDELGDLLERIGRRYASVPIFEMTVRANAAGTSTVTLITPSGTIVPEDPGASPAELRIRELLGELETAGRALDADRVTMAEAGAALAERDAQLAELQAAQSEALDRLDEAQGELRVAAERIAELEAAAAEPRPSSS